MRTVIGFLIVGSLGLVTGSLVGPAVMKGWGGTEAFAPLDPWEGNADRSKDSASTGTSQGESEGQASLGSIRALGRVEPAGGLIDVAAPVGTRVAELQVSPGQTVVKGENLAIVEGNAERAAQVALIEAQLAEAQAQAAAEQDYLVILDQEASLERQELDRLENRERIELKSNLELLAQKAKLSTKDHENLLALHDQKRHSVSEQEMERQGLVASQDRAALAVARERMQSFELELGSKREKLDLQLKKAKAASNRVVRALPIASLKQQRKLAELQLAQTIIRAPCAGRVLSILVKEGESAGPGPVFWIGDTSRMYVVAEVDEEQIPLVRKGQKATIYSRLARRGATGVVESWGLLVAKNDILGLDPTAAAYARVVEVKIKLDEPCEELRDRTNLQVDVKIDLGTEDALSPAGSKP